MDTRTILALGLLGWGLVYLLRPGRSVGTLAADVTSWGTGTVKLDPEQATNKATIESLFSGAGMGWAAPAAVANAYAESRLRSAAVGDGGRSVGLFQLHDAGAGSGMTVAERQDPRANTLRIIATCKATPAFLASRGGTHADVTRAFAKEIERCALCGTLPEQESRVGNLGKLYTAALAGTVAA